MGLISIVVITLTCFAFGDFKRGKAAVEEAVEVASNEIEHPNILFAIAPIVPVVLLVCASIWFPQLKMSVATAMLIGTFYALVVTRSNPEEVTKKFFAGMGNATPRSSVSSSPPVCLPPVYVPQASLKFSFST